MQIELRLISEILNATKFENAFYQFGAIGHFPRTTKIPKHHSIFTVENYRADIFQYQSRDIFCPFPHEYVIFYMPGSWFQFPYGFGARMSIRAGLT